MNRNQLPSSAAAERNAAPLLERLSALLGESARVLEVASGSGQHAEHFARAQPGWHWQPSDVQAPALAVIDARCAGLVNVQAARVLDVLDALTWPPAPQGFDAVFCANMLHIAPWACCAALMAGAAQVLKPRGRLLVYGPFIVDGQPTAASNLAFDADLKTRDARWGLRRLADVQTSAASAGLVFDAALVMPANNLLLVFERHA